MKKNRTLRRTLTVMLAAAAIVSAGNYMDTPLTATTVQAATKKPAAVKNLRATKVTGKAVTVKWAKLKNAVKYNVKVCAGSRCLKNKNVKTNKLTVTGLEPGTAYTVKVTNFTKVKKQNVAGAVATLKVKTKAVAAETPSVEPDMPSVAVPETPAEEKSVLPSIALPSDPEETPSGPQEPTTTVPKTPSVSQDVPEPEEPQEVTTPYGTTFWWDGAYVDADYGIKDPDGNGTIYARTTYMGGHPMTLSNEYMASEDFKQKKAAYETWRDAFLSTQVMGGMTDLEKCNLAGRYIDQHFDYDNTTISDCRGDVYECFARGKAACMESAMILGDFLGHMGIDAQYRVLTNEDHANLWAMLDGQAYAVDSTVTTGWACMPSLELTTLPKHDTYTENADTCTCTVRLMDGTEQTFAYTEAFPTGYKMIGDEKASAEHLGQAVVPDEPELP